MIKSQSWRARLRNLVSGLSNGGKPSEYPLRRVQEIVDAPNVLALNEELSRLVGSGKLDAVYRIRSSQTGAGLADYHRITEIPDKVFDDSSDSYQDVVLSRDVELIYRSPQ